MSDPGTNERDIFISHVEEDADVALRLADRLELAGYTTWCFERDSLPGVSYLQQTGEAIDRSRAVLVVISESLVGSPNRHAENEVVRAYEQGKHLVPILRGMTHSEFQRRESKLRQCIGSANSIVIPPSGVMEIAPRIVKGLEALGVHPSVRREPHPATGGGTASGTPGTPQSGRVPTGPNGGGACSRKGAEPSRPGTPRQAASESFGFSLVFPGGRIGFLVLGLLSLIVVAVWIGERAHQSRASKPQEIARPAAAGDSVPANGEGAERDGAALAALRSYKVDIYYDEESRADSVTAARVAAFLADEMRMKRVVLVRATPELILRIGTPIAREVRYDAPSERSAAEMVVEELGAGAIGASFVARRVESYTTPGVLSVVVFSRWLPAQAGTK